MNKVVINIVQGSEMTKNVLLRWAN